MLFGLSACISVCVLIEKVSVVSYSRTIPRIVYHKDVTIDV